jgi:putative ABC transport system substrate-binding protein
MRRREFIALVASAATWPLAVSAQQTATPVIGFLHSASAEPSASLVKAFRKGLFDVGFIDGQNVTIDFRWADGQNDRLPGLASDLIRRNVRLIATPGSTPAALAAKAATNTIPIVFASGADPVAIGLVGSLNHPGGNVTGIGFETTEITGKVFELLHQLLPNAMHVVALINPTSGFSQAVVKNMQASANALGLQLEVLNASTDSEIENAFANVGQRSSTSLVVGPDPFYTSSRTKIVQLAAHYAIPTMYVLREFAQSGGLISYGPDLTNAYREAGTYSGRVLKGEKPAEMPVLLPTKFDMAINVKTAKSLGIAVPDRLLALADEVIE